MKYKTKIINLVAGPGVGKSVLTSLIFANLKILGESSEIVSEVAKSLVWKNMLEDLNNQYYVSKEQFKLLNGLNGKVEYVITDGSLIHGLIYNKINPNNICNLEKTEKAILDWFNSFNNIVYYIKRPNNMKYEEEGRIQNEEEAKYVDLLLKKVMDTNKIKYKVFNLEKNTSDLIIKDILTQNI